MNQILARDRVSHRGFTISELIVAVGVSLLLIVGVGRIFTTTRTTISTGEASAQLTQYGRTLERLLRSDFASIIRSGQAYMVIRNERLGSGSDVQSRANRRKGLYFDADDETEGNDLGTARLDQMVFFTGGDQASYQYRDAFFGQENIIARNETSTVARVWWGHGLRDPNPDDGIEGIKGAGGFAGYIAQFGQDKQRIGIGGADTANRYVKDWVLARQPALLYTRKAADCDTPGTEQDLSFAPSPIDIFNENLSYWNNGSNYFNRIPVFRRGNPPTPYRAQLSFGVVDLIDMNLPAVMASITEYGWQTNRQTGLQEPWADPLYLDYNGIVGNDEGRDWKQDRASFDSPPPYITHQTDRDQLDLLGKVNERWARQQRYRMMYSTGRIRVETAVPSTDRQDQMLTHATLLAGCSNFEIAWSTGQINYPEGDLVWYDINNPANPYAFHPGKTNRDVEEQTPSDARVWFLTEALPPSSGIVDSFTTVPNVEPQSNDEYYAVFGGFVPRDNDDTRSQAWPWPKMIRVRATLRDPRGHVQGGRQFEFIFNLPDSPDSLGG